jgi:ABC-type nitrate/sulfonate/bicarbonate transport system ATPase subunit
MNSIKISFERVRKQFVTRGDNGRAAGLFTALENITFDVRSGEFLTLVGPSGCGKSTLLDLLGGLRVAVMTARPGRIKQIIDVPESLRGEADDVRSLPEFGHVRHEVWSLLRAEVQKAQQGQLTSGVGVRRVDREAREAVHV